MSGQWTPPSPRDIFRTSLALSLLWMLVLLLIAIGAALSGKMTPQDWQVAQDVVIVLAVLTLAGWIIDYLRRKVR